MSKDSRHVRRRELIREIVRELLDDPRLKAWVREVVLLTLVEQSDLNAQGAVRTFLRECDRRGIKVRAAKDGQVLVTKVDSLHELKAVLTVYRERIWEYLMLHGEHAPLNGHKVNGVKGAVPRRPL